MKKIAPPAMINNPNIIPLFKPVFFRSQEDGIAMIT
jgi:hypothetical protein